MNNYNKAIELLTSREKFHISLGLERISQILELLNNPQDRLKVIHIAGTNGKGSVACMLSAILTEAGYKTGLFTSPHILEYTERIKINNRDISNDDFSDLIFEINRLAKKNEIYLTEFELLTAVGFKYFADNNIDICVLETGLGGRLDATNVIKTNLVSVITSISLEHTERLGDTIEKIAFEKAGIIKENSLVVVNESNLGISVIKEVAGQKNAKVQIPSASVVIASETKQSRELQKSSGLPHSLTPVGCWSLAMTLKNYAIINNKKYELNLLGLYQQENLALVMEVLKDFAIPESALEEGLKKVSWSCRLQYIKEKNVIIDAAHNPDGARVLRESLDYYFPEQKRIWIYGTLKNKDYKKITDILFKEGDSVYLYDFKYPNSASFEEIAGCTKLSVRQLQNSQIQDILDSPDLKIIAGSIYMIGNFLKSDFSF